MNEHTSVISDRSGGIQAMVDRTWVRLTWFTRRGDDNISQLFVLLVHLRIGLLPRSLIVEPWVDPRGMLLAL